MKPAASLALAILHNLSGAEIFVNADEVMLVAPAPVECGAGAKSYVIVHDKPLCVRETPREAVQIIEGNRK
jgi:hypothetical protein